jgi:hypothetical protein
MSRNYTLPEPGDNFIRVEDVEWAIDDYEATEENEQGEFEVPFDPELYIALKDLWTGGDAGHWHGLEDGNYEEMILESHFVEYITDLIDGVYEGLPDKRVRDRWPYRHMKMDYEAAAEEAKEDYTEVTFGGYTYYVR